MSRQRLVQVIGVVSVLTVVLGAPLSAQERPLSERPAKSLYERLGRYDAIAAVVDDFIGRLAADPELGRFFAGHASESKARIRQRVVQQLCAATGGPCRYTGRTMKASHAGLGITGREWDAAVKHLVASLDRFTVPAKEKGEGRMGKTFPVLPRVVGE